MLTRVTRLIRAGPRVKAGPLRQKRSFASSPRPLSSPQTGQIVGPWKGFQSPSWSVEEKLLGRQGSQFQSRVGANDIRRMAALSYLKVPEEKLDSLTKDMDNILRSVAAMEEVNTDNVEPLLSILEDFSLKTRPDLARPTTENSEDMATPAESSQQTSDTNVEWGFVEMAEPKILDNAAQREMGFFVVPKQKQPWEEDDTSQLETEDVAPLKEVQRAKQQKTSSGEAKRS